ncbi:carboxypeptidase regulatory-like domain-containing protein [Joostella sp. CR20]|uniref:carboxypeptidase regulatory-like domain-containing protein n=1 Tax=Joostella sp. CR20 TaxID=2804312 RepID=UPI00313CD4BB
MNTLKQILVILGIISCVVACSEDTVDAYGTGTITGKVVLTGVNTPMENVKVSTNPASSTVFTDENGDFVLKDVEVGDYSVQAQIDGYLTAFEGATVKTGLEVNVIFEMEVETANNKAPDAPQLLAPENGATDQNLEMQFIWKATDREGDSLTYSLEIKNSLNDDILSFEGIKDTTYTVDGLSHGLKYFWQVKVSDSINNPVLSEVYSFTTLKNPQYDYVFTRVIGGNNVVMAKDEDGKEIQLTSSSTNSFRPKLSDAGDKIAFIRTVSGKNQIFVINADGTNEKQLTTAIPINAIDTEKMGFSWANNDTALLYPSLNKMYRIPITGGSSQLMFSAESGRYYMDVKQSSDRTKLLVLETNISGYEGAVKILDNIGGLISEVFQGVKGAVGGVDLSLDGNMVLYTYDVSEYESDTNRQLNAKVFLYNISTATNYLISDAKENGTNDTDPIFASDQASVLLVNAPNNKADDSDVLKVAFDEEFNVTAREIVIENAKMPNQ